MFGNEENVHISPHTQSMVVYVEFLQCVVYNKPSCSLALSEQLCYQMIHVFTTVCGMRELDVDVYGDRQERVPSY